MKIIKLIILLAIAMTSCKDREIQKKIDHISKIGDKGDWVELRKLKQADYFYLSDKGLIYGLSIDASDDFSIEEYVDARVPIEHADPSTFKVCLNADNEPYAKDNKRVYYIDADGVDGILFEDGEDFCAEIYLKSPLIDDADPTTFKYLGQGYAIDKNNIYYHGQAMPLADYFTFEVLERGYAKDKNHIYFKDSLMPSATHTTLQSSNNSPAPSPTN